MALWERSVDGIIAVVKLQAFEYVLSILNSFHQSIEFKRELEQNDKINFLLVLLIRTNDALQTTIYRKITHNGVYLLRNSLAVRIWKRGTLRTILIRAFKICSTKETN